MFGRWSDRVLPSILALALAPIAAAVAADARAPATVPSPESQLEAMNSSSNFTAASSGRQVHADQKRDLAKKLLTAARETNDDPTSRYALLKTARNVATLAGDGELALRAVDVMGAAYQTDLFTMQVDVLLKSADVTDSRLRSGDCRRCVGSDQRGCRQG